MAGPESPTAVKEDKNKWFRKLYLSTTQKVEEKPIDWLSAGVVCIPLNKFCALPTVY